jgi:hypothetical protein
MGEEGHSDGPLRGAGGDCGRPQVLGQPRGQLRDRPMLGGGRRLLHRQPGIGSNVSSHLPTWNFIIGKMRILKIIDIFRAGISNFTANGRAKKTLLKNSVKKNKKTEQSVPVDGNENEEN